MTLKALLTKTSRLNWIPSTLLVVGFGLFTCFVWCFGRTEWKSGQPATAARAVTVEWPGETETLSVGHHELIVRVANSGTAPVIVLGAHEFCGPRLCFKSKHTGPVVANGGETIAYAVDLHVREPGPIEARLAVYTSIEGEITKNSHIIRTVGLSD